MYQVVAKKQKGVTGFFNLTYGRGSKKIIGTARQLSGSLRWTLDNNSGEFKTFRAAKDHWGKWAKEKYENPVSLDEYFPESTPSDFPSVDTPSHPDATDWPDNRHDRNAFDRLVGLYGASFLLGKLKEQS